MINTDFMVMVHDHAVPTVAGLLLFGRRLGRFLPQAAITAVAYTGVEKDYDARERAQIVAPLSSLRSADNALMESGQIEQAVEYVRRNVSVESRILEDGRRRDVWEYPLEAVREAVVNAVVHRDYTIYGTDIELAIYADRLEVISPGRLPNTVTVSDAAPMLEPMLGAFFGVELRVNI